MRKTIFTLLLAAPFILAGYANASDLGLTKLNTPESVKVYKDKIYVSNLGGPNTAKDGFFVSATLNGAEETVLLQGLLDSPKGFAFVSDSVILVADQVNDAKTSGSLVLADIAANKILASKTIPGSLFLNDVAAIEGNTFAVSDSKTNKIYEVTVNLKAKTINYKLLTDKTVGPNGLFYDTVSKRLFVAGSNFGGNPKGGQVYSVALPSKEVKSLLADIDKLGTGALDGIYFDGEFGTLYTSDWGVNEGEGIIHVLNPVPFGFYMQTGTLSGLTSPADFDIFDNYAYVPEFNKNSVVKIGLGESLAVEMEKQAEAYQAAQEEAAAQKTKTITKTVVSEDGTETVIVEEVVDYGSADTTKKAVAFALVILLAAGAYWYSQNKKDSKKEDNEDKKEDTK